MVEQQRTQSYGEVPHVRHDKSRRRRGFIQATISVAVQSEAGETIASNTVLARAGTPWADITVGVVQEARLCAKTAVERNKRLRA